jgi:hypothetical protein
LHGQEPDPITGAKIMIEEIVDAADIRMSDLVRLLDLSFEALNDGLL